jgi:hypothetical protein
MAPKTAILGAVVLLLWYLWRRPWVVDVRPLEPTP